jgi:hypothetical protein
LIGAADVRRLSLFVTGRTAWDAGSPTICGLRGSILLLQGVSEGTYLCISSLVSLIISRCSLAEASNLDVSSEYTSTAGNEMQLTFEVTNCRIHCRVLRNSDLETAICIHLIGLLADGATL